MCRGIGSWFWFYMVGFGIGCNGNGSDDGVSSSSAMSERVVAQSPSSEPSPSPSSRVPNGGTSEGDGPADHFEVLSEAQQKSVQIYCSQLMTLTAPEQPKDTKICASGMAQEILKLEANEQNAGTALIVQMARCAQSAQTVDHIRDCRSGGSGDSVR